MSPPFAVATHPRLGYRHLDPLPTPEELQKFYREHYYETIAEGVNAPELNRLMKDDPEARAEREWLARTLWSDVRDVCEALLPDVSPRSLVDIGCGPGHLLTFLAEAGWQVAGVELSQEAAARARQAGHAIHGSIPELVSAYPEGFHAATLLNVLEHVHDPVGVLRSAHAALRPGGVVVVRVPNDFSELQELARQRLHSDPWWVAPPDHIHYFDFASLEKTIEDCGFKVAERLTDFPMELFILMGDEYVGHPEVGKACHRRRRALELALPADQRRRLYKAFAAEGMGRNALVFARAT
jgi:SAM-dependent methyltransferase